MKYIISLLILCISLLLGHGMTALLAINFPPAVSAMLLLLIALKCKLIKLENCEPTANQLLKYFPLFFIPAGVGIIQHLELVQHNLMLIIISVGTATLLTLLIVGRFASYLFSKQVE